MSIELVELTVKVPKEMQEISACLQKLVADIKAKKGITLIAAETLPGLVVAVEGYDKISDEVKSDEGVDCIALLGSGVYKALKA